MIKSTAKLLIIFVVSLQAQTQVIDSNIQIQANPPGPETYRQGFETPKSILGTNTAKKSSQTQPNTQAKTDEKPANTKIHPTFDFKPQNGQLSRIMVEGYLFQGVSVFLDGKEKEVERAWKNYVREKNDIKLKSRKERNILNRTKLKYLKASKVELTNVINRMGDLLTVFETEDGLVKMTVIYRLGYNVSVNEPNFPAANSELLTYVQQFSEVNFQEYYTDKIKYLKRAEKAVNKEIRKETKVLKKQTKNYTRFQQKEEKKDPFRVRSMEVQRELVNTLKAERNTYELQILAYKSKNSSIRSEQFQPQ